LIEGLAAHSSAPARLVNVQWGFTSDWVPFSFALEQFEAHSPDLQDGLALEWSEGAGTMRCLSAVEVRQARLQAARMKLICHSEQTFDQPSGSVPRSSDHQGRGGQASSSTQIGEH